MGTALKLLRPEFMTLRKFRIWEFENYLIFFLLARSRVLFKHFIDLLKQIIQ